MDSDGGDEVRNAAAALGRLGASKGGHARAAKLSARRRRQISVAAARARWKRRGTDTAGS